MREIKFRAWDGDGYWYSEKSDFVFGPAGNGVYSEGFLQFDLAPENTEMFTGLKDKNGREIYEGDIVEIWANHIRSSALRQIEWDDDETGWYVNLSDWPAPGSYSPPLGELVEEYDVSVVGNIHENPELLES